MFFFSGKRKAESNSRDDVINIRTDLSPDAKTGIVK